MDQLKLYDAVVNGMATTLLLTDADAQRRGLTEHVPPKPRPANTRAKGTKPRTTANTKKAPAGQPDTDSEAPAEDDGDGDEVEDDSTAADAADDAASPNADSKE